VNHVVELQEEKFGARLHSICVLLVKCYDMIYCDMIYCDMIYCDMIYCDVI